MKNLFTFILLAAFVIILPEASAQESNTKTMKPTEAKENQTKPRRRKKVMMCHECGKPEVECECEGEGHGVEHEEHSDHEGEDDA
ncbi:MAG: hypothetical protein CME62_13590 [Halobacteriovoraceae bacterium]|nr:hypothetical protein [Halobacteriovoraceae bacterium]|tara:strand:+ start:3001 stop:3255 length:255 start_codon:yes stop_codon:yes gene_type:complete